MCSSCCQKRALLWAERLVEEVLPLVPYRQLVFTIPRALRPSFLRDRSLYGDLARVAYACTRDFLRAQAPRGFPKFQRAVPAMLVVPQSFGDLLLPHPHGHALCSLGLFTHDGAFLPMEDLDFSHLEETFRERFLELMLRRGRIPAPPATTTAEPTCACVEIAYPAVSCQAPAGGGKFTHLGFVSPGVFPPRGGCASDPGSAFPRDAERESPG